MAQVIRSGVWHIGDTFDVMRTLPDASVDMVLADLPYGTTACKWDAVLPFERLWAEYWRIAKPTAAIVLTAAQPFTSALIMSNPKNFRYCWVWDKVNKNTGSLTANQRPMRRHEDIAVFYKSQPPYNRQWQDRPPVAGGPRKGHGQHVGDGPSRANDRVQPAQTNPCSVLQIPAAGGEKYGLHPTQKPVALFEYLIRTYTNEGDTVLDNTAGSGTTAVAAENSGRKWICIERDEEYSHKAIERINALSFL